MLLLGVAISIELFAWAGLHIFDYRGRLKPLYEYLPKGQYPGNGSPFSSSITKFDPCLGWDSKDIVRGKPWLVPGSTHFVDAFGDSMVYCSEVDTEESLWFLLEKAVGQDFCNLGVPGYGTDQSLLKYKKYAKQIPAKIVVFGVLPDDINRLLLVVPSYRWRNAAPILTKPRFLLTSTGIQLIENPLKYETQYNALLDPNFLSEISKNDACYNYYKDRYGFDLVYGRNFPFSLEFISMVIGQARYGVAPIRFGGPEDLYRRGSEAYKIMKYILNEFSKECLKNSAIPIVIFNCDVREDLSSQNRAIIKPLIKYVEYDLSIRAIVVSDIFLKEIQRQNVNPSWLLADGGHYSVFANQILCQKLTPFFRLMAKGETVKASEALSGIPFVDVDYITAHLAAAHACFHAGKERAEEPLRALSHLQQVLSLDPGNRPAMEMLRSMRH